MIFQVLTLFFIPFLAGTASSECVDKVNDCNKYLANCKATGAWGTYMKTYCSKSCPELCLYCGYPNTATGGGNNGQCGVPSFPQGRIISGVNAKKGAWPWIVSMNYKGRRSHFCGASLITTTWVLTASHCVDKKQPYQLDVVLGDHDRNRNEGTEQRINVRRIIMHPRYGTRGLQHDIALVQLERPAVLNNYVKLACLPRKGTKPPLGSRCYLAGWGSIRHPGPSHTILQQAVLPVVSDSYCTSMGGFICTGYGRRSTINACRGDSGGPYVCRESNGRWVQHGVTSFVVEYCKYYTGFTKISDYMDWIRQYVRI